ncbi:polyhydroxybutyrate depolymerase [Planomonospora sp. ID67723]|nr:polyhydroxybutyrate depolymerase [Planomonospora sp. ID67723]
MIRRGTAVALAVLTAMCAAGSGVAMGAESTGGTGGTGGTTAGRTTVHTIAVDGRERGYRLYRPASLPAKAPLVVMLHGGFGSARQAERSYGWNAEADRRRFAVAYPDGYGRAWNVGGGCCGRPGRQGVDDVAFISRMVAEVGRELRTDPRRVYAAGISNGGMMAYRLACDTTIFAAVGPVAATRLGGCPAPEPLSVVHVHGLADEAVRFDGAPGAGFAGIDGPPVPEVLAAWRTAGRCGRPAVSGSGPVTTELARCPRGRAVELITVRGAGHQWPGGEVVRERADPPSTALDATAVIWRFFAAHPRP